MQWVFDQFSPSLDEKMTSEDREAIEKAFFKNQQTTNFEDDDDTFPLSETPSDGDDMSSDYGEISEVSQIEEEVEEVDETNRNKEENDGKMEAKIEQQ